jgi:O-antigen biosynthesis protein
VERVLFAPREHAPLPPDVQSELGPYTAWVRRRETERVRSTSPVTRGATAPVVLVMAVWDEEPDDVRRTLRCLRTQTGAAWRLTLVVPDDRVRSLGLIVRWCLPRRARTHVRVLGVDRDRGPRGLFLAGVDDAVGSPLALLFAGDTWAPDAVQLLGQALRPSGVAYADEDVARPDGSHAVPLLKPDFSPDLLLSSAYVGRPLAVGADLVPSLRHLVAGETPALEHECALRATEVATDVVHISEVLCHRSSPPSTRAGTMPLRHVRETLRRRTVRASVETGPAPGQFRIVPPASTLAPVSVMIPFRDEPRLLRTCVDSIRATTRGVHADVQLVLIDNGSTDPEALTLKERLSEDPDVEVLEDPRPFNWAALNNAGARAARGEILLFMNNDVEAHQSGWLSPLCAQALRPDVGAVGARLLYPDGRVQHCGLVVGMTGAAGHVLAGLPGDEPGYMAMAVTARECSAVTGACLATRRDAFDLLRGFDESLGVDLNDVDYCLRAADNGLRTMFEPAAELIHHESPSRGTAGGVGDIVHFVERWKGYIERGDRYLGAHLTRADPSCGLAQPDEADAWKRWHETLTMH